MHSTTINYKTTSLYIRSKIIIIFFEQKGVRLLNKIKDRYVCRPIDLVYECCLSFEMCIREVSRRVIDGVLQYLKMPPTPTILAFNSSLFWTRKIEMRPDAYICQIETKE